MRFRLDGVVTVVDAVNGDATLEAHAEAVKQAAVADRIVLTKTDLVDEPDARALAILARLRALNPAAPILDAAAGEATPRACSIAACTIRDQDPRCARWLAEEAYADAQAQPQQGRTDDAWRHASRPQPPRRPHPRLRLATDAAIPAGAFEMFLDLVRSMHGPKLLRMKGVVKIAEMPEHADGGPRRPAPLPSAGAARAWPDGDHRTRIVFIVRDIDPRTISELFDAFLGAAAPDRADRAAIADNPLVPFGGVDR